MSRPCCIQALLLTCTGDANCSSPLRFISRVLTATFVPVKEPKLVIDRTPNPFGKSRTEPNRRFGRTEPSAKLGFPPKGSASGPNWFGLEAEPCTAFREEPKVGKGRIVTGRSLLFPAHSPGYSAFSSGTTAGRRRRAVPSAPPSPVLPTGRPSSLESLPGLQDHIGLERKHLLVRCVLPLGGAGQDPLVESEGRGRLTVPWYVSLRIRIYTSIG